MAHPRNKEFAIARTLQQGIHCSGSTGSYPALLPQGSQVSLESIRGVPWSSQFEVLLIYDANSSTSPMRMASEVVLCVIVSACCLTALSAVNLNSAVHFTLFLLFYFTILYWFCRTSTWIRHGCTWVPNPEPPSHLPSHLSGSFPCTSPKHPVSCIEPRLAIRFLHDIIHISMPFSQITPPSPSPTESKRLFYPSVSLCYLTYRVIITIFLNSIYMC